MPPHPLIQMGGMAGSEYCPSSSRDSEETSTEASVIASQDIPEKQSQKPGDGDSDEDDAYNLFSN